jgi:hypothetical protein
MLKNSLLEKFGFRTNDIILSKNKFDFNFRLIGTGNIEQLFIRENIFGKPIQMDENSISECRKLNSVLGENWNVIKIENVLVLLSEDKAICLSKN